jgi:tRNA(Ile)-lysidine synthase
LDRLAIEGQTGDRLNLPRGVVADRGRSSVKLSIGDVGPPPLPDGVATLAVPGEVRFGGIAARAGFEAPRAAIASAEVDAAAVGLSLFLRRRRNGDRFLPLGMDGTKKLQDFFVDERVPSDQRDCLPIFENERGIVWVGGLRIAEWVRPRPGSLIVHLSYSEAN